LTVHNLVEKRMSTEIKQCQQPSIDDLNTGASQYV